MSTLNINFHGHALNKACSMRVILPDGEDAEGPFPVFYLLHGLSDDHTIWGRRTSLDRYARDLPWIIVTPDGGRSFYCDAVRGPAYESHILRDVIGFVDRHFDTVAAREGRVIGGLSMGGYGALKLGMKYPDLFCSVTSHSGALGITKRNPETVREDLRTDFPLIFGNAPEGGDDCLYGIADRADPRTLPNLWIDCGTEDDLIEDNRSYVRYLDSLEIPHEYQEFPGAHTWDYWDTHIQDAISFHRRILRNC